MKKITLFSSVSLDGDEEGRYINLLKYQSKEKSWVKEQHISSLQELQVVALNDALRQIQEPCEIEIVTDAPYIVKSIETWMQRWVIRDFKQVLHAQTWREYDEQTKIHQMTARVLDPLKEVELFTRLKRELQLR